jgi:hypothetical protein
MAFRYRRLDEDGDMTFGRGHWNFLTDTPEAVAQAVLTRLCLWQAEWFLDRSSGTPWLQQILGERRQPGTPDAAIRARIIGTPFVTQLDDYASAYNSTSRSFVVAAKIWTAFGPITEAPPGSLLSPRGQLVMPLGRGMPPDRRLLPAPLHN